MWVAQRLKVLRVIGAAAAPGNDVVDVGGSIAAIGHLAHRVELQYVLAQLAPFGAVASLRRTAAIAVMVVVPPAAACVAISRMTQRRASSLGARRFRFRWQEKIPVQNLHDFLLVSAEAQYVKANSIEPKKWLLCLITY